MLRFLNSVRLIIWLSVLSAGIPFTSAWAENRVALIIGNQNYRPEVGQLLNPLNDVALLELALKQIGFEVTTERDATLSALHRAVNAHIRRVRAAGKATISLLYYSGHGAQDATTGVNYIIPVDVFSAEDTELWDRSLRLNEITRRLKAEAGSATHFIVIDACRNALKLARSATRGLLQSKGFVPLRDEPGMLVAYATAEGELASDVGSGSGPYARALAEEIVKPGIESVTMFRRVQLRVRASTGQEPWLGFGALGEVYLAGLPKIAAPPPPSYEEVAEKVTWNVAKESKNPRVIQAYLDRYPAGAFASEAKGLLELLRKEEAAREELARKEEELRRSEQAKRDIEANRAEELRRGRESELSNALARAREEARRADEAAKAAAAEREAALKEAENARRAIEEAKSKPATPERTASVAGQDPPSKPFGSVDDNFRVLIGRLQTELKRVGCYAGPIDNEWGKMGKQGLAKFAQATKLQVSTEHPDEEILKILLDQRGRVCGEENKPEVRPTARNNSPDRSRPIDRQRSSTPPPRQHTSPGMVIMN